MNKSIKYRDITCEATTARFSSDDNWQKYINWAFLVEEGCQFVQIEKALFEFNEHGLGDQVGIERDNGIVFLSPEELAPEKKRPNRWMPMTSAVSVDHLGKLSEESGELTSAASRCLIHGIDESHPTTGKLNKRWLEEEIADVEAMIRHVKERFKLSEAFIAERSDRKFEYNKQWFTAVAEESGEFYGD